MFALINFYDLTVIIVVERLITWRLKLLKERVIASKLTGGHLVCFYLSYLRGVPPFLSTAVTSYSKSIIYFRMILQNKKNLNYRAKLPAAHEPRIESIDLGTAEERPKGTIGSQRGRANQESSVFHWL